MAKKRKATTHLKKVIANPKQADNLWLMMIGFVLAGFFSGVGFALANKFVATAASKAGSTVKDIEAGQPPNLLSM